MRSSRWIGRQVGAVAILAGVAGLAATRAAGEDVVQWTVWEKMDPCPVTRQEWMSVGKVDMAPTLGHFPASGAHPTSDFAAAQREEAVLEQGQRFADTCCRDYSIWNLPETSRWVMERGTDNPGPEWVDVRGHLCCEEAAALIDQPGRCGGTPAPMPQNNPQGVPQPWLVGRWAIMGPGGNEIAFSLGAAGELVGIATRKADFACSPEPGGVVFQIPPGSTSGWTAWNSLPDCSFRGWGSTTFEAGTGPEGDRLRICTTDPLVPTNVGCSDWRRVGA